MDHKIKVAFDSKGEVKEFSQRRFEELFGVTYLSHLEYADWTVEKFLRHRCEIAHKKGKVGELALWLGKLHAKALDEGKIADLTIRWIHEKIGYGVFNNEPIAKWQFIGEYTGLLRFRPLLFPNLNDYCFMYPREWIHWKAVTIDSEKHGNETRFINHGDHPNVESVSVYHNGIFRIIFRALKDIPPGSELTYDYGDLYWRSRNKLYAEDFS